jgi:hypothetical protein
MREYTHNRGVPPAAWQGPSLKITQKPTREIYRKDVALTPSDTKKLLELAQTWASYAESTLRFWPEDRLEPVMLTDKTERNQALLACALELRWALHSRDDYSQAVQELGLHPILATY